MRKTTVEFYHTNGIHGAIDIGMRHQPKAQNYARNITMPFFLRWKYDEIVNVFWWSFYLKWVTFFNFIAFCHLRKTTFDHCCVIDFLVKKNVNFNFWYAPNYFFILSLVFFSSTFGILINRWDLDIRNSIKKEEIKAKESKFFFK